MPVKYQLELTIVDGTFDLALPPGVHPGLFVETSVDSLISPENNTEVVRMGKQSRTTWNKKLSFEFSNLEPPTPVIIAMSVFRKRTIHQGFKLVGTARFSTTELIPLLDKGEVQKKVKIHMAKHIPAAGTLSITLNLKMIVPDQHVSDSVDNIKKNYLKRADSLMDETIFRPVPGNNKLVVRIMLVLVVAVIAVAFKVLHKAFA